MSRLIVFAGKYIVTFIGPVNGFLDAMEARAYMATSCLYARDLGGSYVLTNFPLRANLGRPCATGSPGTSTRIVFILRARNR